MPLAASQMKGTGRRRTRHRNKYPNASMTSTMKCSPVMKTKETPVGKGSCYTAKILTTIRDAYNKNHAKELMIKVKDPEKLRNALRERLTQCKGEKEDCWLTEIKDSALRQNLDRYVFAPDKPKEWSTNPNEWLTNFDIIKVLEPYETAYPQFKFMGASPIDFDTTLSTTKQCVERSLCHFSLKSWIKKGKRKFGVVFNLDKHNQPGSHWVSLFIDVDEKIIFYFDSAGNRIPAAISAFVKRVSKQAQQDLNTRMTFTQNYPKVHQYKNTECGVYSLFFIIVMLTGKVNEEDDNAVPMSLKAKLDLFKKQKSTISDDMVARYRNIYFND